MHVFISCLLVCIMGFYVKLGNTCLVASTSALVKHKNPAKFLEIVNSWFWVILLITTLQLSIGFTMQTKSYEISWMTFVGGFLLGLGAYINKACAIGTISRIGDGNFNYLFTPIGMLISVFIFYHLPIESPKQINEVSIVNNLHPVYFFVFSLITIIFLFIYFFSRNKKLKFPQKILGTPTSIVSICFVLLLLMNTHWSYTQVISDIAKNSSDNNTENIILFCLFFIAVIAAGFYLKSFKPSSIKMKTVLNCFFGGAIIGWGSQLIIGSHDSITLYSFPLLLASGVMAMLINLATLAACIKFIR